MDEQGGALGDVRSLAGAPRTDDALEPQYFWEKQRADSLRPGESAQACVRAMLQRIGLDESQARSLQSDTTTGKRLLAYGVEVHLNIGWYARAMKDELRRQWFLKAAIVALAFIGIAAVPVAYWLLREHGADSTDWTSRILQISTFIGAGFAILRFISSVTDTRCRLGLFWRARSDLAEVLYLFEQKWHGQFSMARLPELYTDLDAGITAARQIARAERQQFFDSMISPGDVIKSAQQAFENVVGRFQNAPMPQRPASPVYVPAVAPLGGPGLSVLPASGVTALPAPGVAAPPLNPLGAAVSGVALSAGAGGAEVPRPPAADPALSDLLAAGEEARQALLSREGVRSATVQFTPRLDAGHPGVEVHASVDASYAGGAEPIASHLPDGTEVAVSLALTREPPA
ncbi:MAG TPA: hypothetical protein VGH20_13065 [Myxococcales bacterium]|jgi:hypothetical protein